MYTIELKELMDDQLFEIFDFDMPFYCDSEEAKKEWQCKFMRKYAFYDINSETVARWKWMLETKLIEVMPYYTKLYETEVKAKDIEFLLNKDYRETFMKDTEGTNTGNETIDTTGKDTSTSGGTTTTNGSNTIENEKSTNGSTTGTGKTTETQDSTTTSKVSNIDNGNGDIGLTQGKLTGMSEDKANGTSTQNTENSQTAEQTETSNQTNTNDQTQTNSANSTLDKTGKTTSAKTGTDKQTENYILEGKGNIGTTSSAALLKEWREVLIDIDRLLLDDCKDLFLMVF